MTTVSKNTVARVHYTGTLAESGETFDSSIGRDPLAFLVGHKKMIPGFERELMGAKAGDNVVFTLPPEDAYGPIIQDAIQEVPSDMFGQINAQPGMVLMSDIGPFKVLEVGDGTIKVDFNHALAGKTLTFDVMVVEVRDATEEEILHGHAHGPGGVTHDTEKEDDSCKGDGCC